MNFDQFSKEYLPKINKHLNDYFAGQDDDIFRIMNYSLNSTGKRLRPLLTLAVLSSAFKTIDKPQIEAAAAVEFVHAYSLVHDDLPEMDNDDRRRGQASVWKRFGVGNAVLAGDGLLTEAFKKLSDLLLPEDMKIKLIYNLSLAAGPFNMVRGQQLDLFSRQKIESVKDLELVHLMKTGALMTYAATAGGILADLSVDKIRQLNIFGANLGIAFQIRDDLDDIQQDKRERKESFPIMIGIDDSKKELEEHKKIAIDALNKIDDFQKKILLDLVEKI